MNKVTILFIIVIFTIFFIVTISRFDFVSSDLSLASDVRHISKNIGPRAAGSENEKVNAQYLASKFNIYGFETDIQTFEYYSVPNNNIKKSENVIATKHGVSSKQIIICADLDSVKDKVNGNYTEGANDDATSLAVLLGLAKEYKKEKPYFTIKLVAFGAGEDEYAFPRVDIKRTKLSAAEFNKIMNIPYLVGARYYVLENQDSINNTLAVISLEAVGIGKPCFIAQDSFARNDPLFVDFLVWNSKLQGFDTKKIDFISYNQPSDGQIPISHVYLPFSYANIPSTFLTSMNHPNSSSQTHGNKEIPNYLTVNDTYENLVKNNGNEKLLEKHLDNVLNIVKNSIDKLSMYYFFKSFQIT